LTLTSELPQRAEWLVPARVQLELAKWLAREVGEDQADRVIAFTETCVVADLALKTTIKPVARPLRLTGCFRPATRRSIWINP